MRIDTFSRFRSGRRPKIRNRITLFLVLCTLFPLLILSMVTQNIITDELEHQFIQSSLKLLEQANDNLDDYLNSQAEQTLSFIKDDQLLRDMDLSQDKDTTLVNPGYSYAEMQLFNLMNRSKDVDSAFLYAVRADRLFYVPRGTLTINTIEQPNLNGRSWYEKPLNGDLGVYRQDTYSFLFDITSRDGSTDYTQLLGERARPVITFSHALRDFPNRSILGIVALNIPVSNLDRYCRKVMVNDQERVLILGSSGLVVYSTLESEIGGQVGGEIASVLGNIGSNGDTRLKIAGIDYLMLKDHSTKSQLNLVKLVPLYALQRVVRQTGYVTLLIAGFFIVLSVGLSLLLANGISSPIEVLALEMQKGGLQETGLSVRTSRKDEIGVLYDSFYEMMRRINYHVKEEYKARIREKNAQIKAMQSQINPHFLHNTLQSISTMAIVHKATDIQEAIQSLAAMFKYAIHSGDWMVTIKDEVEHVRHYIAIQHMRFGDRVHYIECVPSELMDVSIPRLSLQPLVENAIVHGIEPRTSGGTIRLEGRIDGDWVVLDVRDDGVGMEASALMELQSSILDDAERSGSRKGVGVHNVGARIIYACKEGSMQIESSQETGTIVHIRIRKSEGGNGDETQSNSRR